MTTTGGTAAGPEAPSRGWTAAEVTTVRTAAHRGPFRAAVLEPGPAAAADPVREVLCVHGLGSSHRNWRPFAQVLAPAAGVRVVAVDLVGFGSALPGPRPAVLDVDGHAEVLAAWLRARGGPPAVYVANSMGCQVVAALAVHAPDLVAPAVLTGPTVDPRGRGAAVQMARLAADGVWERPSLAWRLGVDYGRCGPVRFAGSLRALLADRIEERAPLWHAPVLVVRGRHDVIVPVEWARELTARFPDARLVELTAAGHTVNWTVPRSVAALTLDLLRSSAGTPADGRNRGDVGSVAEPPSDL